ncbi:hypothetical protein ACE1TI_21105 [Alteribacillus sp. JSM 102045]
MLYFKGNVRNTEGKPLSTTRVEFWQNDNSAKYSNFDCDAHQTSI